MVTRKVIDRMWAEVAAGRGAFRVPRRIASRRRTEEAPALPEEEDRGGRLEALAEKIRACRRCTLGGQRTNAVPGEGAAHARLVFVGEAPGRDEDLQGRPFVGPAGQLLTKMIGAMGLAREDVFIANVLKCRPPGNRDPAPEEVAACKSHLRNQLAVIGPDVVVSLGAYATRWFLGPGTGITRARGRAYELEGFRLVPTFHPSYLLRSPGEKRKAWEDLQLVMRLLGLPDPRAKR